ncbi:diacylglycerol kinase family lipid kinase [Micrococcales bacterium 31B]|nr:diacylglycerol kinase family lipid kinase [Micrococcales bacterium 31B]
MVLQGWEALAVLVGMAVIIGLLIAALVLLYKVSRKPASIVATTSRGMGRVAVVVNPTKFTDLVSLRRSVYRACLELGYGQPSWFETTERDPGYGQSKQAINEGAEVVLACGGDGTVRTVVEAVMGTDTSVGIVPSGTGNILARNLDIPVNNMEHAIEVALSGQTRRIDVGQITVDDNPSQAFIVMAGFGFDAAVMMDAPEAVKAKLGWFAYYLSGVKNLRGHKQRVSITVGGSEPLDRQVRTVIIGNVGRLVGGLNLMPTATPDDGQLNAIAMAPGKFMGWGAVAHELTLPNAPSTGAVERFAGQSITVVANEPMPVQVDGDPVGRGRRIQASVEKHALKVRAPRSARA